MAEIVIVGLGPGPVELLTVEAQNVLEEADRIFFRYATDPVAKSLIARGRDIVSFERLYANPGLTYMDVYKIIVRTVIKEARLKDRAVLALPGNPCVFEKTPRWIAEQLEKEQEGVGLTIIPGMSFLDLIYPVLGIDPEEGLIVLNAVRMVELPEIYAPTPRFACLIGQLGLPSGTRPTDSGTNVENIRKILLEHYPKNHPAVLVRSVGYPDYRTEKIDITIGGITTHADFINNLTTLYLPPVPA